MTQISAAEYNALVKGKSSGKGNTKPAPRSVSQPSPAPQIPANPQARFYQSTSVTVEGLGSARLVGFSPEQWQALLPELIRLGFRPY